LTAGAGKSEGSTEAAVVTASAGTSKDDLGAAAAVAGKGDTEGRVGTAAGVTGTARPDDPQTRGDAKEGAKDAPAGQPGGKGTAPGTGVPGGTAPGAVPGDKADAKGTKPGSTGAGEGKGTSATAGSGGDRQGSGAKPAIGTGQASTGTGTATKGPKHGLSIPGVSADAADKAVEDAAKIEEMIRKARPAQKALMTYLAQTTGDRKYVVPASTWVTTILTATDKVQDDDLASLLTLQWQPGQTTPDQLKADIAAALKRKRAGQAPGLPADPSAPPPKDTSPAGTKPATKPSDATPATPKTTKPGDATPATGTASTTSPPKPTGKKTTTTVKRGHEQALKQAAGGPPTHGPAKNKPSRTPGAPGPASKDAPKESGEEYIKRLMKRAADFGGWEDFTVGMVTHEDKPGPQSMIMYFKGTGRAGMQIRATCDVYGTFEKRGTGHVVHVLSSGIVVTADGPFAPAGALNGNDFTTN
jgi:large repetitive protein